MDITVSEMTPEVLKKEFFGKSYKRNEVDDYLEAVRFVLSKRPEDFSNSELKQLQNPTFTVVIMKSGYNVKDVSELIEEIDKVLKKRIRPRRH